MRPRYARTRIYEMGEPSPPSAEVAERNRQSLCAALWHKLGLAVLDPEDMPGEWERQAVINAADARYGRRGKGRIE